MPWASASTSVKDDASARSAKTQGLEASASTNAATSRTVINSSYSDSGPRTVRMGHKWAVQFVVYTRTVVCVNSQIFKTTRTVILGHNWARQLHEIRTGLQ